MSKVRYRYNTKTLSYEKIELTWKDRLIRLFSFLATGFVIGAIFFFISFNYLESPKERMLQKENNQLKMQYALLNKRMDQVSAVLEDVQHRDDAIYRTIFEAEPIADNIRKAGFGGVNRYKELEGYRNSELMRETTQKLDKLSKQLYIQSKSFDEVYEMAKKKEEMLESIPAIQPVSNKDLTRMASGFGYRIHPIYKTKKLHTGMDFSAARGTEIYSTGKGKVVEVESSARGYGNHIVIDHGYGYRTLYAHMSNFNVRVGQEVKRGQLIGYIGNTGTSVAPHLHYEVHKNREKVNPVNFYFNDLSPEEYEKMIELSSAPTQSFD